MDLFVIFVLLPMLALIPAGIAKEKGHNFFGWWLFGLFLFPFALLAALLIAPAAPGPDALTEAATIESERLDRRACPYCAERVMREAVVCRYCGRDLPADDSLLGQMSAEERLALSNEQKYFIETKGYLLPPERARMARYMITEKFEAEEVRLYVIEHGKPIDGPGDEDTQEDTDELTVDDNK